MKLTFTHPTKEHVTINFGQFTQIVGQNQELKYYIWQLLIWYFDGKKYKEEDLSLFQQAEPQICCSEETVKRNEYQIFSISDVRDIIEQMSYKKGSVSYAYMASKLQTVEVMDELEQMNIHLEKIASKINHNLNLTIGETSYLTETVELQIEQLLTKYFVPRFNYSTYNIAFEFVHNETKLRFFLSMLEEILQQHSRKVLLIFKNLDDYLTYSSFYSICQELERMCQTYPQFHTIIFPSNEGYLYLTPAYIEFVNIISEQIEHFYDFDFMYECYGNTHPSNDRLDEHAFLSSLRKIASYLFCSEIQHISLSMTDFTTLKIVNALYQYRISVPIEIEKTNSMIISYLRDGY